MVIPHKRRVSPPASRRPYNHPIPPPEAFPLPSLRPLALALLALLAAHAPFAHAQDDPNPDHNSRNRPERLEWFRDQGFGLIIHFGIDGQVGSVISHSLVGASPEYVARFYTELPQTFDPHALDANDWARLAKVAGIRYMLFTTKHHSGFALWDTKTTPFNVLNTPLHRDLTQEVFTAFRAQGISTGVYFSPDDFLWLRNHGKPITRWIPAVQPSNNPGLLAYDQAQLTELLTRYGPVDTLFLDGEAAALRETAWHLNPNLLVTRGAIQTPEQNLPGMPLPGAWEAVDTMGSAWQYQPQGDHLKSTADLLRELIQTRARGGNFLLNLGPRPDGTLDPDQEGRLREIGLWMLINRDSIYSTRPWIITNEGDLWFTQAKPTPPSPAVSSRPERSAAEGPASPAPTAKHTLYVAVVTGKPWPRATWQEFTLHSVRATPTTRVEVLGQNDQIVEYHPDLRPTTTFSQQPDGLHLRALAAQRLQDNYIWPNPVVLRLTDVEPALVPPTIETLPATRTPDGRSATLHAHLLTLGDSTSLPITFEYRSLAGEDQSTRTAPWLPTPTQTLTSATTLAATITGLTPGTPYEFRALIHHPLLDLPGATRRLPIEPPPPK